MILSTTCIFLFTSAVIMQYTCNTDCL